jgi:lipoprotein-releasing system ATP-binding protein
VTSSAGRPALLELAGVFKDYHGLRPLRILELDVPHGERVALLGFDRVAAEVLVNLVTGAALPDNGRVSVLGRNTAGITDSEDWLAFVDRFGIVSERAVLLDAFTALQNLAMPFALDVEPLNDDLRARARSLAGEVGLAPEHWERAIGTLAALDRMRVRLGRALALDPAILLLEHVSAGLGREEASRLAESTRASAAGRGAAVVCIGVDEPFARAVASRVLWWNAATGRLAARRGWFR